MGNLLEKKLTMEPAGAMTACREVLALLPEPAVLLDESGMVASVNRAFSELVGYAPEELIGSPFEDLRCEDTSPGEGSPWAYPPARARRGRRHFSRSSPTFGAVPCTFLGVPYILA